MKKALTIIILAASPLIALASGDHANAGGANMADMHKEMGDQHHDEASAAGQAGDPTKVSRTIAVAMNDSMRFTPSQISVKTGETIRFFIKNSGKVPHEMVIGTLDELKEHAEMMRKMPGMKHADANQITLNPGQVGGIVWQFKKAGEVDFACLVPGHMEAGMRGKITVE